MHTHTHTNIYPSVCLSFCLSVCLSVDDGWFKQPHLAKSESGAG